MPATAPTIPIGKNTNKTTTNDNKTDRILIGKVRRNIPVCNNTENSFKNITTNRITNRIPSTSMRHLPSFLIQYYESI